MASSQNLRGVAGLYAVAKGSEESSFLLRGSIPAVTRRSDTRYPWPGTPAGGPDSEVDFGSLVEGGPV